ncbi:MAG: ABC transporter ATP-binding protein [Pseudomonadota bacterium]
MKDAPAPAARGGTAPAAPGETAPAALRLTAVSKTYRGPQGEAQVLDDASLILAAGESLALTGESGSGKSTLLHLAAGLDRADAGRIEVAGADLAALDDAGRAALRRRRIGLVFQQFNLIPSLPLSENIGFQARLAGAEDPAWQARLIARLGLSGLEARYPEQLSGGQQQRVAIGRALAIRPPLLLADEPTGNLDQASSDEVMALIRELAAETGCAVLMVTHSERLAETLDRRLRLDRGRRT